MISAGARSDSVAVVVALQKSAHGAGPRREEELVGITLLDHGAPSKHDPVDDIAGDPSGSEATLT